MASGHGSDTVVPMRGCDELCFLPNKMLQGLDFCHCYHAYCLVLLNVLLFILFPFISCPQSGQRIIVKDAPDSLLLVLLHTVHLPCLASEAMHLQKRDRHAPFLSLRHARRACSPDIQYILYIKSLRSNPDPTT
jgi:hypothetical protein